MSLFLCPRWRNKSDLFILFYSLRSIVFGPQQRLHIRPTSAVHQFCTPDQLQFINVCTSDQHLQYTNSAHQTNICSTPILHIRPTSVYPLLHLRPTSAVRSTATSAAHHLLQLSNSAVYSNSAALQSCSHTVDFGSTLILQTSQFCSTSTSAGLPI